MFNFPINTFLSILMPLIPFDPFTFDTVTFDDFTSVAI